MVIYDSAPSFMNFSRNHKAYRKLKNVSYVQGSKTRFSNFTVTDYGYSCGSARAKVGTLFSAQSNF